MSDETDEIGEVRVTTRCEVCGVDQIITAWSLSRYVLKGVSTYTALKALFEGRARYTCEGCANLKRCDGQS